MDPTEQNLAGVMERLALLERTAQWWRNLGRALLLLLGMAVFLGAAAYEAAPTFDSVRARELNIVDPTGRVRALVRVGQDDSVAFALLDTGGQTRASLSLSPDGDPRVRLYEAPQRLRAGLEIRNDGAGATALATSDGTLYFQGVSQTVQELPAAEGLRLRKALTVPEIQPAPERAYGTVDAERPAAH